MHSGKLVYGRPAQAPKCRYLDARAQELGLSVHESLSALLQDAVSKLSEGALRRNGEATVPLFIWKSPEFQSWYEHLRQAGNRLDGVKVLHSFFVRSQHLFSYTLMADVWVSAEQRSKSNEFVFARKDTSAVVAYHKTASGIEVAFVREFRTCVNNSEGFVVELPSGSTFQEGHTPLQVAMAELGEELGLHIDDASRLRPVSSRQLVATLSSHRAHLYAVQLNEQEWAHVRQHAQEQTVFGLIDDGERTRIVVSTLAEMFALPLDQSTLGMVLEALQDELRLLA